jgi:hypothetical protein
MASKTDIRSGITHSWALGENSWNLQMDANLKKLGQLGIGGGVISRTETDPSLLTPTEGDAYIVATSAVGDWVSKDDQFAIWNGTAWEFYELPSGFGLFVIAEDNYCVFKTGSGWSDGVLHTWT